MNIYALSGIRTRDPSNHAASDPRFRSHGHRDWLSSLLSTHCSTVQHCIIWGPAICYINNERTYTEKPPKFNPPAQFLYLKLLCFWKWYLSPVTYFHSESCSKRVSGKESWFVSRRRLFCSYKRTHVFSPVTILLGRLILWRLWGFTRRQWLGIKFQASIQRFH